MGFGCKLNENVTDPPPHRYFHTAKAGGSGAPPQALAELYRFHSDLSSISFINLNLKIASFIIRFIKISFSFIGLIEIKRTEAIFK